MERVHVKKQKLDEPIQHHKIGSSSNHSPSLQSEKNEKKSQEAAWLASMEEFWLSEHEKEEEELGVVHVTAPKNKVESSKNDAPKNKVHYGGEESSSKNEQPLENKDEPPEGIPAKNASKRGKRNKKRNRKPNGLGCICGRGCPGGRFGNYKVSSAARGNQGGSGSFNEPSTASHAPDVMEVWEECHAEDDQHTH